MHCRKRNKTLYLLVFIPLTYAPEHSIASLSRAKSRRPLVVIVWYARLRSGCVCFFMCSERKVGEGASIKNYKNEMEEGWE